MTSNLLLKSGILIVIGLIFFPETVGANSSEDNDLVKTQRCISWTSNEYVRQTIETARKLSQPCPCHKSIIETDLSYYKSGHCYIQRFFTDGGKQKCCYDKYGSLSLNYPDGGYLILEQSSIGVNDVFKDCCHGDKTTCELFYMVNPSDNCSAFTMDSRTTSWGDPQITTVDNHTYTFNGHGEYIYLDLNHGALTIQARTEYLQEGNIDATIFTVFALTINDTEKITLLLDNSQKNKTVSKVNAFSNHTLIKGVALLGQFRVIVHEKEVWIAFDRRSNISQINRVIVKADVGLSMSLDTTASVQQSLCVGLAGFTRNNSFISRTTEYGTNINALSSQIFDFGESWMLHNKSESVFDYTLTNGTFKYYNDNHTRPIFPEDYLNNLTAMFNIKFHHNESDVEKFRILCEGYIPCLTEIARSDESQLGKQILDEHKRMVSEEQRKRNKPPWFTDEMPKNISIISTDPGGFSLNLTKYVKDDQDSPSKMSFYVDTNINTTDYSLKNGIFNLTNISLTLRSEDIFITFIVKDKWNFTALAPVTIFFCGRRSASQCNFHVLQSKATQSTTDATVVPVPQRSDIDCRPDSISVYIPQSLLSGGQNVTWRDENCSVTFNVTHYTDTVKLTACGTTVGIDDHTITFSNDLIVHKTDDKLSQLQNRDITFGEGFETVIPVKCVYARENNLTSSYAPIKQHVRFVERRHGQLDLSLEQYQTAQYKTLVPSTGNPRKVPLNGDIYLRVGLDFPVKDLRVKVDQCIATSTPSPSDINWHQLIKSGCPIKPVRLLSSPVSQDVKFSFKAFDFRHNSSGFVYIHCEVTVCRIADPNCMMGCANRTKRAASVNPFGGSHLLSTGPFVMAGDNVKEGGVPSALVFAGACLSLAVIAVGVAILGWTRKSRLPQKVDGL